MEIPERGDTMAQKAEAFRERALREVGADGSGDLEAWESFAATGKIGDYLRFVAARENRET